MYEIAYVCGPRLNLSIIITQQIYIQFYLTKRLTTKKIIIKNSLNSPLQHKGHKVLLFTVNIMVNFSSGYDYIRKKYVIN